MQVIPVLDLLNCLVVHAQQGKRDTYRPIQSPLSASANPFAVIDAMLAYYPFKTFYLADLNSIQQKRVEPQHYALIKTLCKRYPMLTFWVDAGATGLKQFDQWSQLGIKPILGSENFKHFDTYAMLIEQTPTSVILSLDFINGHFIGNQQILTESQLWPETVIAMTLDQVGTNSGPNWHTLKTLIANNTHAKIVAAGGVRQLEDLHQLKTIGINGALMATALHHQQLTSEEIASVIEPKNKGL